VSPRPSLPADPWPAETVTVRLGPRPELEVAVRSAPAAVDAVGPEPAVMLHGLGGSALNWTDLMALLADRLESRAPDLPGFGLSPPPSDHDYSIGAQARLVARLVEMDGRGPVHLMGNSLGGAVATTLAAYRPDLVRTLTLISPALPDLRPNRARTQVAVLATPVLGTLLSRRLNDLSPEERVAGLLEIVYADPTAVTSERRALAEEEVRRRSEQPYAVDALASSARALLTEFLRTGKGGLWRLAARVTAPTLVVYARQDRLVSHSMAPKAKASFPNATVVVVDSGHVAQMEHPLLVERYIRKHLGFPAIPGEES
jgi:pimeloyl-ACP methyl ester carboxylesterase